MHFAKESVFFSALRTFCTAFGALIGAACAILVVVLGLSLFSGPSILPPEQLEISIAADADGNRKLLPMTTPVILRIDLHGVIGEGKLTSESIEKVLYGSREDFLGNNRVKAILLHIDTPGGIASDADGIDRLLMNYKKKYNIPIYAFVDGICASGGMYIAAAADKIYATGDSIIGAIGVIMGPAFNFSEVMKKVGVESLTLTEGKDKDMLNPFRPWKPGEDASLRTIMDQLYARFVDVIITSRPQIGREKLINEYGAHVFSAVDAQKIGYIDVADSEYSDALTALCHTAGISADAPYQVVSLKTETSFVSSLIENRFNPIPGKITHVFQIGPNLNTEMSGKFLYLYTSLCP
ncbi:MAG: S49 family peptidase [Chlamydiota bacterium]